MATLNIAEHNRRMELYRQGLNDNEIARAVGYCTRAICYWRCVHDLQPNYKKPRINYEEVDEMIEMGLLPSEIAIRAGCSESAVYQRKNRLMRSDCR